MSKPVSPTWRNSLTDNRRERWLIKGGDATSAYILEGEADQVTVPMIPRNSTHTPMIHPTTLTLFRAYMKKTIQERREDLKGRRLSRYSPQQLSMQEHERTYGVGEIRERLWN
jgi:hypothetical protein